MNVDQAKQLFEEIVELCYHTENKQLIEIATKLYPEVENTDDILIVKSTAEELQITIQEIEFLPEEEDYIQEMNEKIELLSE